MQSILAVDDSASMRKMVSFTLTGAGYHVVEAVDGEDAFEKAQASIFDLVLTDQNMPRLDGLQMMLRLRADARWKALPLVAVSASSLEHERRFYIAQGLLDKPGEFIFADMAGHG